jgi:2-iminobutanoate/2-iminopropanoate deaminase
MKRIIATQTAPAAVGPYSQAVVAGNLMFCSGQIALDPATGTMVGASPAEQTEQVMKNVSALLAAEGLSLTDVVKATVFATDMGAFPAVNEVYARFFTSEPPARSFVEVSALPKNALVEIEVIAYKR